VPTLSNFKAWLEKYKQEGGPVCQFANVTLQIVSLLTKINHKRNEAKGKDVPDDRPVVTINQSSVISQGVQVEAQWAAAFVHLVSAGGPEKCRPGRSRSVE
jgi:hypothetical protein